MDRISGKIVIAGDLFPVPSNLDLFSSGNVSELFGPEITGIFAGADYRICNLEGSVTDGNEVCEKTGPVLKAPTRVIAGYKALGINCCTLANNHITDGGHMGVVDTLATLDNADIRHLGAGVNSSSIDKYICFEVAGSKILLYNVAETMYNEPTGTRGGAHLYDEYIVCKELEGLKKDCDLLIVIYHGGSEKYRYPTPQTQRRFHRMADSGADIIISQHTHCIGCEERYNGSYLLYGQGNFLFRSFNNEYTDTGLLLELLLDGRSFEIRKHMVRAIGDKVRLDSTQDFSEYDERSSRVCDTEFLNEQFKEYCLSELPHYLKFFYCGKPFLNRVLKKISPSLADRRYNEAKFSRKQLTYLLHAMRSEQNREVAINGLKEHLNRTR